MRGEGNVAVRRRISLADHLFDLLAGVVQGHALRGQCLGGNAFTLTNQAQQQMLGADVVVLEVRASSCANTITRRARSVNRSNMLVLPLLLVLQHSTDSR